MVFATDFKGVNGSLSDIVEAKFGEGTLRPKRMTIKCEAILPAPDADYN